MLNSFLVYSLCQEPSHIPLRCDQVEKSGETAMRKFIESRMSEAMLRTCANCNRKFYKTEGCNKMTCICGKTMCYLCRAPNIDYEHFTRDPQGKDGLVESNRMYQTVHY